ncbi:MAG: carboxymuconolactone decarboxylase family protein [Pseudomonadota bacterium]
MPDTPLRRVKPDMMPETLRASWEKSRDVRGDATFIETMANEPRLFEWYRDQFYGQVFHGGRVPTRLKELARYRLSTRHGCHYCNQGNRLDARAAGLNKQDLNAIENDELDHFAGLDRAVLMLADQMLLTEHQGQLKGPVYDSLSSFLDDGQIIELGMTLAVLTGMARFLFVFDLVEKEANCPFHPGD